MKARVNKMRADSSKNWKNKLLIAGLVLMMVLGGCIEGTEIGKTPEVPSSPSIKTGPPFSVNLSVSTLPYLNQPVDLTVSVVPTSERPNFSIKILLPKGIQLIEGDLMQRVEGPIARGEIVKLTVIVKVVEKGHWTIKAIVGEGLREDWYEHAGHLYINASDTTASISRLPPGQPMQSNVTERIGTQIGKTPETPKTQGEIPTVGELLPGIITNLTMLGTPALNQPVEIVFVVTSLLEQDVPNSTVQVVLPEGFVLLDGDLTWEGTLPQKGTVKLNAKIEAVRTGEWKITGGLTDIQNSFFNWNFLYVEVFEMTGRFSHLPFEQLQQTIGGEKMSAPINLDLSISGKPSLNQIVVVTLTATPKVEAPNSTLEILVPKGFVVVSGDIFWKGTIDKGATISLSAQIKPVKTGHWTIEATAMSLAFGKTTKLFVLVTESAATSKVSNSPLRPTSPEANATVLNRSPYGGGP